jgi:hypothetical protein
MATDVESGELAFAGQVGPEVRIGLRPMKGGHGVRVSPLGTWIGFKAGYQTAGLGPEGGFVEASLGLPVLALTAGVDVGPPWSGGEGAFVEPYLGLSLHLDLGW